MLALHISTDPKLCFFESIGLLHKYQKSKKKESQAASIPAGKNLNPNPSLMLVVVLSSVVQTSENCLDDMIEIIRKYKNSSKVEKIFFRIQYKEYKTGISEFLNALNSHLIATCESQETNSTPFTPTRDDQLQHKLASVLQYHFCRTSKAKESLEASNTNVPIDVYVRFFDTEHTIEDIASDVSNAVGSRDALVVLNLSSKVICWKNLDIIITDDDFLNMQKKLLSSDQLLIRFLIPKITQGALLLSFQNFVAQEQTTILDHLRCSLAFWFLALQILFCQVLSCYVFVLDWFRAAIYDGVVTRLTRKLWLWLGKNSGGWVFASQFWSLTVLRVTDAEVLKSPYCQAYGTGSYHFLNMGSFYDQRSVSIPKEKGLRGEGLRGDSEHGDPGMDLAAATRLRNFEVSVLLNNIVCSRLTLWLFLFLAIATGIQIVLPGFPWIDLQMFQLIDLQTIGVSLVGDFFRNFVRWPIITLTLGWITSGTHVFLQTQRFGSSFSTGLGGIRTASNLGKRQWVISFFIVCMILAPIHAVSLALPPVYLLGKGIGSFIKWRMK